MIKLQFVRLAAFSHIRFSSVLTLPDRVNLMEVHTFGDLVIFVWGIHPDVLPNFKVWYKKLLARLKKEEEVNEQR